MKLKLFIVELVVCGVIEEKWFEVSKVIFDEMYGWRVE